MNDDHVYRTWLTERQSSGVPEGFSGRVLDMVRREAAMTDSSRPHPWLLAGAWAAASVVLLVRLGAMVAVFWPR